MTTAILIEKLRDELGTFDVPAEQAVAVAREILQRAKTAPQPLENKFISRNIPLEEYRALSREEKRSYHDEAEELNWRWVENQLNRLNAKWLMVVEGQVVMYGETLDNYPDRKELLALCERIGKYPFAFFSPRVFAIEELSTAWHETKEPDDAYPAISIALFDNSNRFETEADLDTGAVDCYASLEMLTANGVVTIEIDDVGRTSKHLSRAFNYFVAPVWLELIDDKATNKQSRITVICVENWLHSPFTAINPARTCLVGRRALLKLRPRLVLDFDARCTEVQFKMTPS